ncbi:hypothetical protein [Vibrio campbellii]|uniref:hypothetical protein n=1 Tax=Vibrio campbellii TaxID=680 RepID=UPI003F87D1CF
MTGHTMEFFGLLLLTIICIPIFLIVINMGMGVIWLPIKAVIDFLFRYHIGRVILSPLIFIAVGMAGMRLIPSLVFGGICGAFGVYILLWKKDE